MKLLNNLLSNQPTTTILSWLYWIRETCEDNVCPGCPLKDENPRLLKCKVRNALMDIHPKIIPKYPDLWSLPKRNISAYAPDDLDFIPKLQWSCAGNPILKLRR